MKMSSAAICAAFALTVAATPVLAIEAENNKQAPAPQGTTAPESNSRTGATTSSSAGGGTSANTDLNTGSSGTSDGTTGAGPATDEKNNTKVPAPANTEPPTKR